MKRFATGLLVLSAVPAWAQTSVQIGGILDQAVRMVHNQGAGSIKSVVSGANATGRLTVRGEEDLSAELKAGFWLESAIGADTGSGGTNTTASPGHFWDRNSYMYLSSPWGQVRFGYDQTQLYKAWAGADPFGNVGIGSNQNVYALSPVTAVGAAWSGTAINTTTLSRARNLVAYYLPRTASGLYGGAGVAPREAAVASTGQARFYTGLLGYANRELDLALAVSQTKTSLTGDDSVKELMLRGSYDFGFAKFALATRQWRYRDLSEKVYHLGAWVPLGSTVIKASLVKVDNAGRSGTTNLDTRDATQLALGLEYKLSKRTLLYGTCARLMNKGTSALTIPGGPGGMSAGRSSSGAEAGIRHNF
jgi:predicted porin